MLAASDRLYSVIKQAIAALHVSSSLNRERPPGNSSFAIDLRAVGRGDYYCRSAEH